tara:strand:- start:438 stop:632 length:195 start_codon:yes stop_codon:yes gene_type:complete
MAISNDDIEDAGKGPKEVQTDEGTVKERPIDDLIKADQHSQNKQATSQPLHGLKVSRFKPGGAA